MQSLGNCYLLIVNLKVKESAGPDPDARPSSDFSESELQPATSLKVAPPQGKNYAGVPPRSLVIKKVVIVWGRQKWETI